MPCPRCQHENLPQAKFCLECGAPLSANPTAPPGPSYVEITSALSEALERETATSEILRVISSSPTDVQPVFAAVLTSAAHLCDALDASIFQVDGDGLRLVAHGGPIPSHPVGEFPRDSWNDRGTCGTRSADDPCLRCPGRGRRIP
jgi:Double zinc ribbon